MNKPNFMDSPNVLFLFSILERYRLQSDSFESMWLPLHELVARLNGHFKRGANSDFRVSFDGALPLQEYFELVDMHFNVSSTLYSFCAHAGMLGK